MIFREKEHELFYLEMKKKCRYQDICHKALCYCLGIEAITRNNIYQIYDFRTGMVKTECIHEGWQTTNSLKIVRLAFALYTNTMPTLCDIDENEMENQLEESSEYNISNIFCSSYAVYFWEAIKIRYSI